MNINLILLKKNGSRKKFPLLNNITVIGRNRECDLRIRLMLVSKRHCQLTYNEGTLKIRDLGSLNGTYLNGKRINEATVKPGSSIKIGPLTFLCQIDGQPEDITQTSLDEDLLQQDKSSKDQAEKQPDVFPDLEEIGFFEDDGSSPV